VRTSLGLAGDLDDIELIEDIEQAFGTRLSDDQLTRCETVGDLFDLIVSRLPVGPEVADRCATAMCFYRLRSAVLTILPDAKLRPSTPIAELRTVPVRPLYHLIRSVDGLNPPAPYLSSQGGASLLVAVVAPIGLLSSGAPWWMAFVAVMVAIALYRLSPVRLPPHLKTFGDLVELVTARSMGALAARGARLGPPEAWTALQSICEDHAVTKEGDIHKGTLITQQRKATL
jgi:hypothetical protein